MKNDLLQRHRDFLKDSVRKTIDFSRTDQSLKVPPPPIETPFPAGAERIDLVAPSEFDAIPSMDLFSAIRHRESRRKFTGTPVGLDELSFLLWATQGVRVRLDAGHALRTVPSAGARHALETYLCVMNVTGLQRGAYRYLPLEHQLLVVLHDDRIGREVAEACFRQTWMSGAAVVFVWAAVPYRMEWRYGLAAHKVILLDAGHVCQNLYLSCEAIGAGACAVAAYDQELLDRLLHLDGNDEFAMYLAAVGKVEPRTVQ
jgi:SagB-type dehydrogenase family enzyme